VSKVLLALALPLFVSACSEGKEAGDANKPLPGIIAEVVTEKEVSNETTFVGQTRSSQSVDIQARVKGTLLERPFEEGTQVKEGAVLFKIDLPHEGPGWLQSKEGECHERDVARILEAHGLHVIPPVLAVDYSREIMQHPYVIQARVGGTRLGDLLDQVPEPDAEAIYDTVGEFYQRMHAIHHERSGIWTGSTPEEPWGDPTGFMYRAEVVEGSGRRALEQGRITQRTYERAVALWGESLDDLGNAQPSLIHHSAFPWNIYLEREHGGWRITKLTSVGDVMWWDPACDLACLQYPPFGDARPACWKALLRGYGSPPERKRILLFAVMQRLCAAMGAYMEPWTERNRAWAARCLGDVDAFLDEIERG